MLALFTCCTLSSLVLSLVMDKKAGVTANGFTIVVMDMKLVITSPAKLWMESNIDKSVKILNNEIGKLGGSV